MEPIARNPGGLYHETQRKLPLVDPQQLMSTGPALVPRSQAQPPFFLGIDVGGTNIKLGVVDDLGRALARESIATLQEQGADSGVRRMAEAGRDLLASVGL